MSACAKVNDNSNGYPSKVHKDCTNVQKDSQTIVLRQPEQLLREVMGDELTVLDLRQTSLVPTGENYGSSILKVDVVVKKKPDAAEERLDLVAKMAPAAAVLQEWMNVKASMPKEIYIFKELIPQYRELQREVGIAEKDLIDVLPRYYGGRFSLDPEAHEVDFDAALLMENLKCIGYESMDRKTDNEEPVDVKFVDFQLTYSCSPMKDLPYFLTASLSIETINNNFEDLIDIYYEKFIDTLKTLKCDTTPFAREKFDKQLRYDSSNQLYRCMAALKFFTMDTAENNIDLNDLKESVVQSKSNTTFIDRLCRMIEKFVEKEWLDYLLDTEYVVKVAKTLLTPIGIWPRDGDDSPRSVAIFWMRIVAVFSLMLCLLVPHFTWTFFKAEDLRKLMKIIAAMVFSSLAVLKYWNMIFTKKEIRACLETMEDHYRLVESDEARQIMLKNARIGRLFTVAYLSLSYGGALPYHIIMPLLQPRVLRQSDNSSMIPLPYPSEYVFFIVEDPPLYQIVFVGQILISSIILTTNTGVYSLIACIVMHCCCLFEVTGHKLECLLDGRSYDKRGVQADLVKRLVDIVDYHNEAIA
ncbi:unnamed protein product [Trichogramma brassicae]|uniref:CHK kinase-like domain-containing protein n=1 Tax=Trichogramma brassicae TaxID=86971 RepID=A0A6H5IV77_9HYME|nr:unnamed protein product [Trichogramma brassicae]